MIHSDVQTYTSECSEAVLPAITDQSSFLACYLNSPWWLWCVRGCAFVIASVLTRYFPLVLPFAAGPLAIALLCTYVNPCDSPDRVAPLATDGQPLVFIEMKKEGVAYGHDLGRVIFSGGWLRFEGSECQFSLCSRNAVWMDENGQSVVKMSNGVEVSFYGLHREPPLTEELTGWFLHEEDDQPSLPPTEWQADESSPRSAVLVYTVGAAVSAMLCMFVVGLHLFGG